jgi:hypothetical protein
MEWSNVRIMFTPTLGSRGTPARRPIINDIPFPLATSDVATVQLAASGAFARNLDLAREPQMIDVTGAE